MVCVVTSITVSIFNISPILNVQLHSRYSCECNCTILKIPIFDIFMPCESLRLKKKVYHKTQNPFYFAKELKRACFLSHILLEIYVKMTYALGIYVETAYTLSIYKKKGYCELLVLLSMLFVKLFVHTR